MYLPFSILSYTCGHGDPKVVKQRDQLKSDMCRRHGIHLVVIPYWWNKKIESVAHAIKTARPDVIIRSEWLTGDVIPNAPSDKKFEKGKRVDSLNDRSSIHSAKGCNPYAVF